MKVKYSEWQSGAILPILSGGYERRVKDKQGVWSPVSLAEYSCHIKKWLINYDLSLSIYQASYYKKVEWQWRGLL